MKIFVNAYLENNLGDDLFFEILQNRYPNQEYYLLSSSYKTTNNCKQMRHKCCYRRKYVYGNTK